MILIDQLEAILPQSDTLRRYTPMRRNDVYELIRQLIDDLDFFKHTLILLAADEECLSNERYGLQSYHALWMRIQPGFIVNEVLNPYADLIDANKIMAEAVQKGEFGILADKLKDIMRDLPEAKLQPGLIDEYYTDFRVLLQNRLSFFEQEAATDE